MGIWFPDDVSRGNRVEQLASDIQHLQSKVKQKVEDTKEHDKKAIEYLNKIIQPRGFKTLDELVVEVEKKLSKEDKDNYLQMKNNVQHLDDKH